MVPTGGVRVDGILEGVGLMAGPFEFVLAGFVH